MRLPAKHIEFIKLVASGGNQSDAYKATVGNPKATSAQVKSKASNLAKKYAKEIQEAKKKAQSIVDKAADTKEAQIALKEVLTQAQVDAELCKIISGVSEVEKIIIVAGERQTVMCKPDHSDKLKAIDLYNKRFGSNAVQKHDLNVTNIPAPIINLKRK